MRLEKCNKTLLLNAITAMSITLVATVLVFFIYTVNVLRWKYYSRKFAHLNLSDGFIV